MDDVLVGENRSVRGSGGSPAPPPPPGRPGAPPRGEYLAGRAGLAPGRAFFPRRPAGAGKKPRGARRRPSGREAPRTVLLRGGTDDDHAVYMVEFLRRRGADAELLDSRWSPAELRLAFDPAVGGWTVGLPGGRVLDGRQIQSVYW